VTDPGSYFVEHGAVVSGWPAFVISRLLSRCHDDVADLPPHLREPVEEALEAIRGASAAWATARGSAAAMPAEVPVSSTHEPDELDTQEVADMLQVSARRVRQLAADGRLPGRRTRHRWRLDAAAVLAYSANREQETER